MTGIEHLQRLEPYKALPLLQKSAKKNADYATLVNLAAAERGCGMLLEARESLMRAMAIDKNQPEVWNNLGQVAEDLGEFEQCALLFQKALEIIDASLLPIHQAKEALFAYSHAMLRLGHFEAIWDVWETARFLHKWAPIDGLPLWRGETGARLLVLPEGGFGDTFNFLRWVPRLGVDHVTILVRDDMHEYVRHVFESAAWKCATSFEVLPLSHVFRFADLQKFTHCAPYMSLARGTKTWSDIPAPLNWEPRGAEDVTLEDWTGFCWNAEEAGVMRKTRPLDDHMADRIGKHLSGAGRVIGLALKSRVPKGVDQDDSRMLSWEETARTILKCRRVVTVDTGLAHLAGSLGVPTLMLLPVRSSWMWGIGTETTAFYGSNVKVFRNQNPTQWDVDAICSAIDQK